MSTKYAIHSAAAVKQISTVTIAGDWTGNPTVTLTMNNKAMVITIGANNATTDVAIAIRNAWQANTRLDSESVGNDATSNFGGQEFGEFSEVTATIDKDTPSVVTLTAIKAGVPFTVSVAETASGSATLASAQAATGPWHWDNAKNWDSGTVPADNDILVFKDQSGENVGFKYGLPNGTLEVTINHWMSYTGQLGLPPINGAGPKAFPEYRQRGIRLDDHGDGTSILHRFGLGKDGTGSPLINVKHSTLECRVVVYKTGSSQVPGGKALNICCTADTSLLNVLDGSVDCSSQDGGTSAFLEISQAGGDVRAINALKDSATMVVKGGTMLAGGSPDTITYVCFGGTLRIENATPATSVSQVSIFGGATVEYASSATIGQFAGIKGTFDARLDGGAFNIDAGDLYRACKFLDPYHRITAAADFLIHDDPSEDWQFGTNDSPKQLVL